MTLNIFVIKVLVASLRKDLFDTAVVFIKETSDLKEKLNTNSSNSPMPPSSDFKKEKKKKSAAATKIKSGKNRRKQGGQSGHKGVSRALLLLSAIDKVVKANPPKNVMNVALKL